MIGEVAAAAAEEEETEIEEEGGAEAGVLLISRTFDAVVIWAIVDFNPSIPSVLPSELPSKEVLSLGFPEDSVWADLDFLLGERRPPRFCSFPPLPSVTTSPSSPPPSSSPTPFTL